MSPGLLCPRHKELIAKNPIFNGTNVSNNQPTGLKTLFPNWWDLIREKLLFIKMINKTFHNSIRSDFSMTMVSACLNVDPVKRPGTEQLSKFSLFTHDNFNIWFVQELQEKLNEEFSSNPLLKSRKSLPSPSMIKGATVDIPSKRSSEKVSVVRNFNAIESFVCQ